MHVCVYVCMYVRMYLLKYPPSHAYIVTHPCRYFKVIVNDVINATFRSQMKVIELLGWNPLGRRWERELLLSNPLGNLPRRELTSIVVDCLLQSIVAQALGELIHHVLLEKIQKLGPATLLFRHGSSCVIRFCFSGWIFTAPNRLARLWASTSRAESRAVEARRPASWTWSTISQTT